jgi:hypothetical protein
MSNNFQMHTTGVQKCPNLDRAKRRYRTRARIAERDAAEAQQPKPPETVKLLRYMRLS